MVPGQAGTAACCPPPSAAHRGRPHPRQRRLARRDLGCLAGALSFTGYRDGLTRAGFTAVIVTRSLGDRAGHRGPGRYVTAWDPEGGGAPTGPAQALRQEAAM
jgi:hypothetical protein